MKKHSYEAPKLDVMEVAMEKGFAMSNGQQFPSDWEDM